MDTFTTRLIQAQAKKRLQILAGEKSFKLSRAECIRYLHCTNETFHDPVCHVEYVKGEHALIKAVFFGSGILSHPVRRGTMPVSAITGEPSLLFVLWLKLVCLLDGFWSDDFIDKY